MANRRPSQFVGEQVREFRERRRWQQQDLARRLAELGFTGWRQTKISKIEKGQAKRLSLDEVLELAIALDVAPLYLFTPTEAWEGDELVSVQLGPKIERPVSWVREWVRGEMPLFDPKEDRAGARFYLVESVPIEAWDGLELSRILVSKFEVEGRDLGSSESLPKQTKERRHAS